MSDKAARRPAPANLAAERALLGGYLHRRDEVAETADLVRAEDWYDMRHGAIYEAILAVLARHEIPDVVTVEAELRRLGTLERGGGMLYLVELSIEAPLRALSRQHARLVRDESLRRRVATEVSRVYASAWSGRGEPAELAADLAALAREVAERAANRAGGPKDLASLIWSEAEAAFEGRTSHLASSLAEEFAGIVPPLAPGELLVIGGRPKSGKSHLAADLAYGWARRGHAGIVLTAEDSPQTWARREAAKIAGVDAEDLRLGRLNAGTWEKFARACADLGKLPCQVEWVGGGRAVELGARMASAAKRGARFAVVDYVQLVKPSRFERGTSGEQEMASVVRELKEIAGQTGLALILVSQMRRYEGGGAEPRPRSSELRNTGMLEAQADAVVLIWRPSRENNYSRCTMILDLHKHGAPCERELNWLPHSRRAWALGGAKEGA